MTIEPLPAAPDTKDWTWVLSRPCPDCGYQADTAHAEIPALIRANVSRWQLVLQRPGVAQRPAADVWSPLEYACHVRDVYRIFSQRLDQMLESDDPQFANWDQDATAIESRYWAAGPKQTSHELTTAGEALAARFGSVSGDQWQRPGRRSNGSIFTVETLARYGLHDDVHHLMDVGG